MAKLPPRRPIERSSDARDAPVASRPVVARRPDPRQPGMFDPPDPMPALVPPCKPTLVEKPPVGKAWSHELKWDGYRIVGYVDFGQVRIMTRNAKDWTSSFPSIAKVLATLPVDSAIVARSIERHDGAGASGDVGRPAPMEGRLDAHREGVSGWDRGGIASARR